MDSHLSHHQATLDRSSVRQRNPTTENDRHEHALRGVRLAHPVAWTSITLSLISVAIIGMAMWPRIIVIALLAAVVTVAAFDVGMVGWMLLLHFNDWMPPVSQVAFWFLMQLGVLVGLLTRDPSVRWLLASQRPGDTITRQMTSRGAGA